MKELENETTSSEDLFQQMKFVFERYDTEKQGFIDKETFQQFSRDSCGYTGEQASQLTELFDPHHTGKIWFRDFERLIQSDDPFQLVEDDVAPESLTATSDQDESTIESDQQPDTMAGVASPLRALSPADSGLDVGRNEERYECDEDEGNAFNDTNNNNDSSFSSFLCDNGKTSLNNSIQFGDRNTWSRRSIRGNPNSSRHSIGSLRRDISAAAVANASLNSRRSPTLFDQEEQRDISMTDHEQLVDNLSDKVQYLQTSLVGAVQEFSVTEDNLKKQNTSLSNKIRTLEEKIRELEFRLEESVEEGNKKFSQMVEKKDRERKAEFERKTSRILDLEREQQDAREDIFKLKSLNESIQRKNKELQSLYDECTNDLQRAKDEVDTLQEKYQKERDASLKAKEVSEQVIMDLSFRLEQSIDKNTSLASETHGSNRDISSASNRLMPVVPYEAMEKELERLRLDNRHLKQANKEFEDELLAIKVEKGQNLLETSASFGENNWAAESDNLQLLSREELLNQLKSQKETNSRLKEYVGNILSSIMLTYPEVLEKKD